MKTIDIIREDYRKQAQKYFDRMAEIDGMRYQLRKTQLHQLQALEQQRRAIIDDNEARDRELTKEYHEIELELGVVRDVFSASLRTSFKKEEGGNK